MYIILTAAEADQVRGETVPGHTIEPILLKDGAYAVPPEVLKDRHHAAKHGFLKQRPARAVKGSERTTAAEQEADEKRLKQRRLAPVRKL